MDSPPEEEPPAADAQRSEQHRWLTVYASCAGLLMAALDTSAVNVALPSIKTELDLSPASLAWVVNAYMIPYGGFLLLCGRLGDHFGRGRVFRAGISLFTAASLACAIAGSPVLLVLARIVQGCGAAAILSVSLALIASQFKQTSKRVAAVGGSSLAIACGGSAGLLLGGILTDLAGWRWIFFINVPVGTIVYWVCCRVLPKEQTASTRPPLDVAGAITVTTSLLLVVYATLAIPSRGLAMDVWCALGAACAFCITFLVIEKRARAPLVSVELFRSPVFSVALIAGMLWVAAQSVWLYNGTLYLQTVLGYRPLAVGLSFLPFNLISGIISYSILARWSAGSRLPFSLGALLIAVGLSLFSRAPVEATFLVDVLPAMVLIGAGTAVAWNPLVLNALGAIRKEDYGTASGLFNGSLMIAGALGVAVSASIASARISSLRSSAAESLLAITGTYRLTFMVAALLVLGATVMGALHLRVPGDQDCVDTPPER